MYDYIVMWLFSNMWIDIGFAILVGIATYFLLNKKGMKKEKTVISAYFMIITVIVGIMIICGNYILANSNIISSNIISANQTEIRTIEYIHNEGGFIFSTGLAIVVFSVGLILNIIFGHTTDKKIDEIYQIVSEIQKNTENPIPNLKKEVKKEEIKNLQVSEPSESHEGDDAAGLSTEKE